MLLKQATLTAIQAGTVTLAFRRWRRPTVKTGGTLLTSVGQLAIASVDRVQLEDVTEAEATAAGFVDRRALRAALSHGNGDVYRIRLSVAAEDPRIALRAQIPDAAECRQLVQRLDRFDARSASGAWTRSVLETIRDRPAERAADLARALATETLAFKVNVRKLKALGLTQSLEVGYRLSPRGAAVLDWLHHRRAQPEPVT